jgi:copper transport protein
VRTVVPDVSRTTLLVAVFLAAVAVVGAPARAEAHAALIGTTPPAGSSVPRSPDAITLTFSEAVTLGGGAVTLTGPDGPRVLVDPPWLGPDGRSVRVRLRAPLPDGTYTVRWQVTAGDGDLVGGSFRFGVGTTAAGVPPATRGAGGGSGSGSPGLGWAVALRWLLFGGMAAVAGGLVGQRLTGRHRDGAPAPAPYPWLWQGALAGLAATVGLAARLVGGGSPVAALRHPELGLLTAGTAGRLLLAEAVAFAAASAACLALRLLPARARVTVPALALVWAAVGAVGVAEGLRGHPHEDAGALGTLATTVHVLAAAVWVGALVHVVRTGYAWRARRGQGWLLAWDYARLAAALFGAVAVTGLVATVAVLPSAGALTRSGYGRVLLAKLALVAAVGALALLARRRFRRAPAPEAGVPPGGPARAEVGALVGVLGVTALLVSLPPASAGPAGSAGPTESATPGGTVTQALPPPVVGPSVSLGTLAGQVTVGLTASADGVRLQLYAPDPDPRDEVNQTTFAVTATVTPPGGGTGPAGSGGRELRLRGCGGGCFTGRMEWPTGVTTVRVGVSARPWHGGTAAVDVPWPPRLDTRAVPAAVAAVRAAGRVTVHERVTSDGDSPAGPSGTADVFPVTAARFLASEPYGSGVAPPAAVLARRAGRTELSLAYLAEGVYVRLVVGPDHRVEREVIAAPNELVTRTFDYP